MGKRLSNTFKEQLTTRDSASVNDYGHELRSAASNSSTSVTDLPQTEARWLLCLTVSSRDVSEINSADT